MKGHFAKFEDRWVIRVASHMTREKPEPGSIATVTKKSGEVLDFELGQIVSTDTRGNVLFEIERTVL